MRIAVIQFPGSNCDRDAFFAFLGTFGQPTRLFFHKAATLKGADVVVIPGGFSYGDYLRAGAIARFSPIMKAVKQFADEGGPVIGICNGFQILCESGLLPGALVRNACQEFRCQTEILKVEDSNEYFNQKEIGETLRIPIAHQEGCYMIDDAGLQEIEENHQVLLRYANNPNGSVADIAGVRNDAGNVIGLMPHPERAVDPFHPSRDGIPFLRSFLRFAQSKIRAN